MKTRISGVIVEARECLRALWPAYLLASILILWGFTWSLPDDRFIQRSFHPDEVGVIRAVDQIRRPDFNPHWFIWGTALFYQAYVIKMLAAAGGLIPVNDGTVLLIGRAIVGASALGAITCLFLLGRRIFDAQTGRLAAMILAVLPGFIINSHYFKTDVPMTFWLLAAMVAGYRLVATGSTRHLCWLGLLIGYGGSTKYSAGAAFPAGLVFLTMGHKTRWTHFVQYGACAAAGFLLGTPRVLPDPSEFLNGLRTVAEIGRSGACYVAAYAPAWVDYMTRIARLGMTFPIWIAAALATVWMLAKNGRVLLPVWVFLAAYSLVLSADNIRLVRYTVPLLPFAALFIAGLWRELTKIGQGQAGKLALAAVGLLMAYALLYTISYVRVMTLRDSRVQASEWIARNVPRDAPFPISTIHYAGGPQVQLWGFRKFELADEVDKLRAQESPYVAVSEWLTQRDRGARNCGTGQEFFQYLRDHYAEVARFENPQRLLGIDSKEELVNTHDWLYPNPRITIYKRADLRSTAVR